MTTEATSTAAKTTWLASATIIQYFRRGSAHLLLIVNHGLEQRLKVEGRSRAQQGSDLVAGARIGLGERRQDLRPLRDRHRLAQSRFDGLAQVGS